MKVLNFGSLNYDYVYKVDHIVEPGETLNSLSMNVYCGGKGFNQSVALARAGVGVYQAGMVGEDDLVLRKMADEMNIDMTYVKTIRGQTGHAIIQVNKEAQNCILLYGGANRAITKEYVDQILDCFSPRDFLLLQNEISEMDYIISQAAVKGMTIVLNPSPYDENIKKCDLCKVNYFLINEIEGEQITGQEEPKEILKVMMKLYPNSHTVLTLGKKGAYYEDKSQHYYQKAYRVKTIDTTAAGDTFVGYFIYGLLQQLPIKDILDLCARASSLTVSRSGAAISIPTIEEINEMIIPG